MSWIKVIKYADAGSALKKVYNRIKGPNNYIDNVFSIHSLRPRTLTAHMTLYKNTIHNPDNTLPKWYLEAIGVYVSHLNGCTYCVKHHSEGFKQLYPEPQKAELYLIAVKEDTIDTFFEGKFLLGLDYAWRLTLDLQSITEERIDLLRTGGFTDGEILELNQVVGYFNYGNRTARGLGVNTDGDILGPAPKEEDL